MNTTWVSQPISEDRPSDEEIFGEFHNTETLVFPWEDEYIIEETDDIATYRWILHLE